MDDVVNRFARELADAIAAAVAENPQVEACREKARAAGFEMKVTLEAVVGFVNRSQTAALAKVDRAGAPRVIAAAADLRGDRQRSPLPSLAANRGGRDRGTSRIAAATAQNHELVTGRLASSAPAFFISARRLRLAHPRGRGRRGRGIAQVVVPDRLQVVVELVDERDAGRDVQLDDRRRRRCRRDTSRARAGCCRARR